MGGIGVFISILIIAWVVGGLAVRLWLFFNPPKATGQDQLQAPAGRIHLFHGDRHLESSTSNPYENESLDWESGRLGTVLWDELTQYPNYHPALIGTIEVIKPDEDFGKVAALLDNEKVAALGYEPVGISAGAEWAINGKRTRHLFQHH